MTINVTSDVFKSCKSVKSINEWVDRDGCVRFYLNLWDFSPKFRGDQTCKLFVDARGILNYVAGKGTKSPLFRENVQAVLDHAEANGIEVRKV